jgi:hypothetical protein
VIADDAKREAGAITTDTTADAGEPTPAPYDRTADAIIADCDGDPRAAVAELLAIIRSLIHECENVGNIDPPITWRSPLISLRLRGFDGGHALRETKPHQGHSFSRVIKGFRWTRGGVTLVSAFTISRPRPH